MLYRRQGRGAEAAAIDGGDRGGKVYFEEVSVHIEDLQRLHLCLQMLILDLRRCDTALSKERRS